MHDGAIDCRIQLAHDDFVMDNHRVHGVSVMPGVTLLDAVHRVLAGAGLPHTRADLRDVLFPEPIATEPGRGREIRVLVGAPDAAGVRAVSVSSRWEGADNPWHTNLTARLLLDEREADDRIDPAALRAGAVRRYELAELYARARAEDIRHGPAMTCRGTLHVGDGYLLAELDLDPAAAGTEELFHLHPAKMDASTIAAYGQTEAVSREPFIPMFVEGFRAPRPLRGRTWLYAPGVEVLADSGDVITNSYGLYDDEGVLCAEVRGLTCKRIRFPGLITRLLHGGTSAEPPVVEAAAPGAEEGVHALPPGPDAVRAHRAHLRELIGRVLDRAPADVPADTGFYDLGLDSVALLDLGRELERAAGTALYPTLLFEFTDVAGVAAHLGGLHGFHAPTAPTATAIPTATEPPSTAATTAAGPAPVHEVATRVYRPVWTPLAPAPEAVGDVVVVRLPGTRSEALAAALRPRHDGALVDATGQDVGNLLAGRARPVVVLVIALDDPDPVEAGVVLWDAAGALARTGASGAVHVVHVVHDGSLGSAVAGAARTIAAESPSVRCRAVEVDDAPADALAALVLTEAGDRSPEVEVRHRGPVRSARRHLPAPAEPPVRSAAGGVHLITGAAGGVAGPVAEHLARRPGACLVLVGRDADDPRLVERAHRLAALGARVLPLGADLTDAASTASAVAAARARFGRVDGVLHLAGVTRDGLFVRKGPGDLRAVVEPKLLGAVHLDEAIGDAPLDFFAVASSLTAAIGNTGQSDYAYANGALEDFARRRAERSDRAGASVSIGWPMWAEGGMRLPEAALRRVWDVQGTAPMPTADGLAVLDRLLSGPDGVAVVVHGDPARIDDLVPPPAEPVRAEPARTEPVRVERAPEVVDDGAIAVIGLAGRYPQAPDLDAFWRNLLDGVDSVVEVPAERWDHDAHFDPRPGLDGRTYSRWGGFLDGVDRFDHAFFGISRRDAERMDPQERLFLTTCWQAMEDAGQVLSGRDVGVFAGVTWSHYQLYQDAGVAPVAMHASVANRVSHVLDLTGPSLSVDTACSSSLTAVHLAVQAIRRGECELAFAGGVNTTIHPQKYLQLSQGQFLSPDGRCRSFGAGAAGYVPGEGVGAVLLKPLSRALADGDHVHGVIRGTALNHTGRTGGFTVPSPTAQTSLIRRALTGAGVAPATVGYVEAHGTGTSLGDPIELDGLRAAFGTDLPAASVAIGSVKSNIGHLEAAAGIAGLTKVLLQLKHRTLVPSLHADEPNPHLRLAGSPFAVQRDARPWLPVGGDVLRAGISAFGAGGANSHLVVEEPPRSAAPPDTPATRLFVLSARDDDALRRRAEDLLDALDGRPHPAADHVLTTLLDRIAALLDVPVDRVDPAEPLTDLGFDLPMLLELARRCGDALGAPLPVTAGPGASPAHLAALVAARSGPAGGGTRPALRDIAHTLATGRTPLRARLAVVAADADELRAGLRRHLDGAAPSAGCAWGTADPETAPDARTCLDLHRAGDLTALAAAWVAGADVPWDRCAEPGARRVPLPTYPFREQAHWVGRWRSASPSAAPNHEENTVPTSASPVELRVPAEGIALVTMRGGHNMFTPELLAALEATFAEVAARTDLKVVVLTGSDGVFCMGGTPEGLADLADGNGRFTDAPFVYEGLPRCPLPVIAAMDGHAAGGGLAFGLHADVVLLAREAGYAANFLKFGFTPGVGATQALQRRFGASTAAEMFFGARTLSGAELERRGAHVVVHDAADVLPAALELARSIAAQPRAAVVALKEELAGRVLAELSGVVRREVELHERVLGAESLERVRAHQGKADAFRRNGTPAAPAVPAQSAPTQAAPVQAGPAPVYAAPIPAAPVVTAPVAAPVERVAAPAPVPAGPPAPARAEVVGVIEESLCAQLFVDRHELDPTRTFNELGVDSIGAVTLVRAVNERFGLDLDSVTVYDHPDVARLTDHVLEVAARSRALLDAALAPGRQPAEPVQHDRSRGPAPVSGDRVASHPPQVVLSAPSRPAAAPLTLAAPRGRRVRAERSPLGGEGDESEPARAGARAHPDDAIAVIGVSGRFPDAPDVPTFWHNLVAGHDSVREVPRERWDVDAVYHPDRLRAGTTNSRWAAMLSDVDLFDAAFFQLSPAEAELVDPQQRLFLMTAWSALEDAGQVGGGRCGVFVGAGAGDYLRLVEEAGRDDTGQSFLGSAASILPARIAYHLNLTGPTIAVDTACSSSLVAVHLACDSLRAGECDTAVAGGVAVMNTPRMHVWTGKTGMLSPTGRSAPFDASADGIVLGEACAAVVLKRLDRALADGDRVHAVIRAGGVNGDGRTNGITAPSATSQASLLRAVHARAGISAEDVDYVEAHGTGTALGDPIEVKALAEVLGGRRSPAVLGSVKANVGHTTLAAGITSLVKVVLALRNGELPPSPHFTEPNPDADLTGGPLRVLPDRAHWYPGPSGVRTGVVSSFGFSGTNCHLVLQEAPPAPADPRPRPGRAVVALSARTAEALRARIDDLRAALAPDGMIHSGVLGGGDLTDVAHTLAVRRTHFRHRVAFVARDLADLRAQLDRLLAGAEPVRGDTDLDRVARDWQRGEGDLAAVFADLPGRPVSLPGYPFARDRHWIAAPGDPAPAAPVEVPVAVPAEVPAAAPEPAGPVTLALAPDAPLVADHVLSGTPVLPGTATIALAVTAARRAGLTGPLRLRDVTWLRPLAVDRPTTATLTVDGTGFDLAPDGGEPCATGRLATGGEPERVDLVAARARCARPVPPADLYSAFDRAGLRYGPGFRVVTDLRAGADEVLATLAPREPGGHRPDPRVLDGALQTVAALVGERPTPLVPHSVDEVVVHADDGTPTHAHAVRASGEDRFDVRLCDADGRVLVSFAGLALRPHRGAAPAVPVYVPRWTPAPAPVRVVGPRRVVAVHAARGCEALAAALAAEHAADDVRLPALDAADPAADLVYVVAAGTTDPDVAPAVFRLLRALARTRATLEVRVVLAGAVAVRDGDPVRPGIAALVGLARAAGAEHAGWRIGCVDVPAHPTGVDPARAAALVVTEDLAEPLVAWRDGQRLVRRFAPLAPPAPTRPVFADGGTYLITGGAGGLGLALSGHLAREHRANLVWVGRRPSDAAIGERAARVSAAGGQVLYLSADVTDPESARWAVRAAKERFGGLDGVVHAAGVWRDGPLATMADEAFAEVLAPKLAGATALLDAVADEDLDVRVVFSSAASFVRPPGQANYAAGSTALDAVAAAAGATVVNWGYWGGVGAVADEAHARRFAALGVGSISPDEGFAVLRALLASGVRQALVLKADVGRFAEYGLALPSADRAVRDYVRSVFADVLKLPESAFGDRETFENYGVDSLNGAEILRRFSADLGELPATLLFEHVTIEDLAARLADAFAAKQAEVPAPAETPDPVAEPAPVAEPGAVAAVRAREVRDGDIAVIGVSGRYPKSPDLDALWTNLLAGANCVTEVPADRWDWRAHFDPRPGVPNRSRGRWAGFLDDIAAFDAPLFGVLPREAAAVDPQERLFLETCWNLLESTGHLGRHGAVRETGVFVGVMYGSYGKLAAADGWPRGEFPAAHSAYWSIANRVSYTFDLTGPSLAVDSACSSSLTAVHLACESLRRGECRQAVAGGVNLVLHPAHLVALSGMTMLAGGDGCRAFDADADGYVPGEGVGAVLLKPLADALADGDDVWAVIRGGFANAGGKTSGYTVPNPTAQAALIAEALRRADVDPATVDYVEAHGTGTQLGDPIEVAALNRALGRAEGHECALGSVKANLGHLEGAAGIAGLTKVLLQLRQRTLVPAANLARLNPKIDFRDSPLRVQREAAPWPEPVGRPRRAGVSSFGAGGANVHIVLEEHVAEHADPGAGAGAGDEHLVVLSARDHDRLRVLSRRIADHLAGGDVALARIARTTQLGRREMSARVAVRATDLPGLVDALRAFADGAEHPAVASGTAARTDAVVPPDASPATTAAAWVTGAEVDWRARWRDPLPRVVPLPTYPFDHRNRYWAPGPVAAEPGTARSGVVEPGVAEPGTGTPGAVPVRPAADRPPLDVPEHLADHRVGGARWLPAAAVVESARHGRPAAVLRDLRWSAPVLVDDLTGPVPVDLTPTDGGTRFAVRVAGTVLASGLLSDDPAPVHPPVSVADRCTTTADVTAFYAGMAAAGLAHGPGLRVVDELRTGDGVAWARLSPRVAPRSDVDASLLDGALQAVAAACGGSSVRVPVALAELAVHGVLAGPCEVHVTRVGEPGPRELYDADLTTAGGAALVSLRGLEIRATGPTDECSYTTPVWRPAATAPGGDTPTTAVLLASDAGTGEAVADRLERDGVRCVVVVPGVLHGWVDHRTHEVVAGEQAQYGLVVRELAVRGMLPDAVVRCWDPGAAPASAAEVAHEVGHGFAPFLWLTAAVLAEGGPRPVRALYTYAASTAHARPHDEAAAGALRTAALEHSGLRAAVVGFEGARAAAPAADLADTTAAELLSCEPGVAEVRHAGGQRLVRSTTEWQPGAPTTPTTGGTYLVTGGAGAVGLHVARHLARRGGTVVLVGRSALDDRRRALVATIPGATHEILDVADPVALRALVERVGPLRGVVHAAGVRRDSRLVVKTAADLAAVLRPKVAGTLALDEATADQPLDFFALFSSVVAGTGNPGQADYAYANAFLDAFAEQRDQRRAAGLRAGRTVSIGWSLWADGGMTVDAATEELLRRRWGLRPLPTDAALAAFDRAVAGGVTRVTVSTGTTGSAGTTGHDRASREAPAGGDRVESVESVVTADLRALAADFLLVEPDDVELDAELLEQGFDSITLTELVNRLNERYGLDLLPTVLFEHPTLGALAVHLDREHRAEIAAATSPGPVREPSAAPAAPATPAGSGPGPEPGSGSGPTAHPDGIAVVGMAGMFPGSPDLESFWRNLLAGRHLVGPVPDDRADLLADERTADVRGGFLDHVDRFDARLFGIAPREAALMDPQQRLFLQTAWRAVEDAGYRPSSLAGTATGLFAAVSTSDYDDLLRGHDVPVRAHTATGIAHSVLANRVSYLLNLRGPSEAVDTACSGSLVAVHRAVAALRAGECDLALAGGVNALLSPGLFSAFTQSGMLSPSGACQAFAAGADGYVRGEGCGVLLLKPLRAALADGDHVYGVVTGSAVNHGGRAASLTAPNPEAQAQVVVRAHRAAGVDPRTVGYVEAHGTGTALGDPVEVEGLKRAFATLYADHGLPVADAPHVAVGSVKSNIGHLEAAAGAAGLVKALLAVSRGVVPATLHVSEVNPLVRLDGTPLRLATEPVDWSDVPVRRAGVSSFGFGGANAHVVVESAPPVPDLPVPTGPAVFPLSATTEEALRRTARALADHVERTGVAPATAAHVLQTGRDALPERAAFVAADRQELIALLRDLDDDRVHRGRARRGQEPAEPGSPLDELSRAWVRGAEVDWAACRPGPAPRRVPLPGTEFADDRHWFDTEIEAPAVPPAAVPPAAATPTAATPTTEEATVRPAAKPAPPRPKIKLSRPGAAAAPVTPAPPVQPAPPAAPAPPVRPVAAPAPPVGQPATPVPDPAAATRVARLVTDELSNILGTPAAEIEPDRPFGELGLDSIYRMDLVRLINSTFALDLKAVELYDHDTVDTLAAFVAPLVTAGPTPAPAPIPAPAPTPAPAAPARSTVDALVEFIADTVGHRVAPDAGFEDSGFTSFDLLRVVAALERGLGALRKTLLLDHPTPARLAAHLDEVFGEGVAELIAGTERAEPSAVSDAVAGGELVVGKRELDDRPELADLVRRLDLAHAKEGGLPGRDIAPLIFLGSRREGYFHFSRRGDVLFAWSYVGSAEYLPELAGEWLAHAAAQGAKPAFLAMSPMAEAGGRPLSATPFGAVQRIEDLSTFDVDGPKARKLRNQVNRFERAGKAEVVEYAVGSDPATDAAVAELIGDWAAQKDMVNPYVRTVRDEIGRGVLGPRHRAFLTRLDGVLQSAVIVTRIPSERAHLLDLEFYRESTPRGCLEHTIVEIIRRLAAEGDTSFSFGGTFGVRITGSPNADPDVERGLAELRSLGVFTGEGNFRFKNKFQTTNHPVYLCQPADQPPADVASIILMIANPPAITAQDRATPEPAPTPAPAPAPTRTPAPTSTRTPAGAPHPTPSDGDVARRDKALSRAGHNPLRIPAGDVEFDFTTDSWTELDTPHVRAHSARLATAAQAVTAAVDLASGAFGVTTPLPHRCVVPTGSGRSAEALLCRAWPGRRGDVVQNALFPTWAVSQLDHGFTPVQVRNDPAAAEPFLGDLDLVELDRVLAAKRGRVSFVCVELSTNARGGHPVSLANLRGVREVADRHGVPLVLDATRGLENAAFVREHELRDPDRPLVDVLAELLAGARAVTIGMSKDYGVTSGGLVLTDDDELAATLREQVALRGVEAGLATRRLMTAALADTAGAERAVLERMSAVRALWQAVVDAGLPVVGPAGGHAVLLDAARLPGAAGLEHPVASALAWVFRATGVRAAPHLDGDSLIRLAVPVGTTTAQAAEAGARLAALARSGTTPPALVRAADAGGTGAADAAYYPADRLPDDVREAMDEGHRPLDENFAVLTGYRPDVRRVLVRVGSGEVEAFTAGSGETLLLMHPFNIGAGFFGPQFAALADRYRVLAVHHSGVGATTEATDISVHGLADLFARTLDALDVAGPVHVAGASFGGIVAMAFALRHRARTASLTLIGSSYRVGNRAGEMNRLSLVADEDFRRLERNGVTVDRAGLQRMLLRCESMSTHTGLRYLDEFATDPGLLPRLPELDVPVLQVHGALDTVIPLKTGHLLHGTLPDVRFHEFPDAGHFPSLTAADRFNALLDGFLAERSAAGAATAGGVR